MNLTTFPDPSEFTLCGPHSMLASQAIARAHRTTYLEAIPLAILIAAGGNPDGLTPADIAQITEISESAANHHLQSLRAGDYIQAHKACYQPTKKGVDLIDRILA